MALPNAEDLFPTKPKQALPNAEDLFPTSPKQTALPDAEDLFPTKPPRVAAVPKPALPDAESLFPSKPAPVQKPKPQPVPKPPALPPLEAAYHPFRSPEPPPSTTPSAPDSWSNKLVVPVVEAERKRQENAALARASAASGMFPDALVKHYAEQGGIPQEDVERYGTTTPGGRRVAGFPTPPQEVHPSNIPALVTRLRTGEGPNTPPELAERLRSANRTVEMADTRKPPSVDLANLPNLSDVTSQAVTLPTELKEETLNAEALLEQESKAVEAEKARIENEARARALADARAPSYVVAPFARAGGLPQEDVERLGTTLPGGRVVTGFPTPPRVISPAESPDLVAKVRGMTEDEQARYDDSERGIVTPNAIRTLEGDDSNWIMNYHPVMAALGVANELAKATYGSKDQLEAAARFMADQTPENARALLATKAEGFLPPSTSPAFNLGGRAISAPLALGKMAAQSVANVGAAIEEKGLSGAAESMFGARHGEKQLGNMWAGESAYKEKDRKWFVPDWAPDPLAAVIEGAAKVPEEILGIGLAVAHGGIGAYHAAQKAVDPAATAEDVIAPAYETALDLGNAIGRDLARLGMDPQDLASRGLVTAFAVASPFKHAAAKALKVEEAAVKAAEQAKLVRPENADIKYQSTAGYIEELRAIEKTKAKDVRDTEEALRLARIKKNNLDNNPYLTQPAEAETINANVVSRGEAHAQAVADHAAAQALLDSNLQAVGPYLAKAGTEANVAGAIAKKLSRDATGRAILASVPEYVATLGASAVWDGVTMLLERSIGKEGRAFLRQFLYTPEGRAAVVAAATREANVYKNSAVQQLQDAYRAVPIKDRPTVMRAWSGEFTASEGDFGAIGFNNPDSLRAYDGNQFVVSKAGEKAIAEAESVISAAEDVMSKNAPDSPEFIEAQKTAAERRAWLNKFEDNIELSNRYVVPFVKILQDAEGKRRAHGFISGETQAEDFARRASKVEAVQKKLERSVKSADLRRQIKTRSIDYQYKPSVGAIKRITGKGIRQVENLSEYAKRRTARRYAQDMDDVARLFADTTRLYDRTVKRAKKEVAKAVTPEAVDRAKKPIESKYKQAEEGFARRVMDLIRNHVRTGTAVEHMRSGILPDRVARRVEARGQRAIAAAEARANRALSAAEEQRLNDIVDRIDEESGALAEEQAKALEEGREMQRRDMTPEERAEADAQMAAAQAIWDKAQQDKALRHDEFLRKTERDRQVLQPRREATRAIRAEDRAREAGELSHNEKARQGAVDRLARIDEEYDRRVTAAKVQIADQKRLDAAIQKADGWKARVSEKPQKDLAAAEARLSKTKEDRVKFAFKSASELKALGNIRRARAARDEVLKEIDENVRQSIPDRELQYLEQADRIQADFASRAKVIHRVVGTVREDPNVLRMARRADKIVEKSLERVGTRAERLQEELNRELEASEDALRKVPTKESLEAADKIEREYAERVSKAKADYDAATQPHRDALAEAEKEGKGASTAASSPRLTKLQQDLNDLQTKRDASLAKLVPDQAEVQKVTAKWDSDRDAAVQKLYPSQDAIDRVTQKINDKRDAALAKPGVTPQGAMRINDSFNKQLNDALARMAPSLEKVTETTNRFNAQRDAAIAKMTSKSAAADRITKSFDANAEPLTKAIAAEQAKLAKSAKAATPSEVAWRATVKADAEAAIKQEAEKLAAATKAANEWRKSTHTVESQAAAPLARKVIRTEAEAARARTVGENLASDRGLRSVRRADEANAFDDAAQARATEKLAKSGEKETGKVESMRDRYKRLADEAFDKEIAALEEKANKEIQSIFGEKMGMGLSETWMPQAYPQLRVERITGKKRKTGSKDGGLLAYEAGLETSRGSEYRTGGYSVTQRIVQKGMSPYLSDAVNRAAKTFEDVAIYDTFDNLDKTPGVSLTQEQFKQAVAVERNNAYQKALASGMSEKAARTLADKSDVTSKRFTFVPDEYRFKEGEFGGPGTGPKRYGALSGKYILEDVFAELRGLELLREDMGLTINKWIHLAKAAKTIHSIITTTRNMASGVMLLAPGAGFSLLNPGNWKYLYRAIADMMSKKKPQRYLFANKYGLHGGDVFANEFGIDVMGDIHSGFIENASGPIVAALSGVMDIVSGGAKRFLPGKEREVWLQHKKNMEHLADYADDPVGFKREWALIEEKGGLSQTGEQIYRGIDRLKQAWKLTWDLPGLLYSAQDNALRLATMYKTMEQNAGRWTDALHQAETTRISKAFVDTRDIPGAAQALRMVRTMPTGPTNTATFGPAFAFLAAGSPFIGWGTAAAKMLSKWPTLQPWHVIINGALHKIVTAANLRSMGLSMDDRDALLATGNQWQQNDILLGEMMPEYGQDEEGRFRAGNVNFIGGPGGGALAQLDRYASPGENLATVARSIFTGPPFVGTLIDAAKGVGLFGKDLVDESTSLKGYLANLANASVSAFAPAWMPSPSDLFGADYQAFDAERFRGAPLWENWKASIAQVPNRAGRVTNEREFLINTLLGMRANLMQPTENLLGRVAQVASDHMAALNSAWRDTHNDRSSPEFMDADALAAGAQNKDQKAQLARQAQMNAYDRAMAVSRPRAQMLLQEVRNVERALAGKARPEDLAALKLVEVQLLSALAPLPEGVVQEGYSPGEVFYVQMNEAIKRLREVARAYQDIKKKRMSLVDSTTTTSPE